MELRITKIVPDKKRNKVYLALEGKKQAWVENSYLEDNRPVVGGFYGVSHEGVWYVTPEAHQLKLDALHVEDEEPLRIE